MNLAETSLKQANTVVLIILWDLGSEKAHYNENLDIMNKEEKVKSKNKV